MRQHTNTFYSYTHCWTWLSAGDFEIPFLIPLLAAPSIFFVFFLSLCHLLPQEQCLSVSHFLIVSHQKNAVFQDEAPIRGIRANQRCKYKRKKHKTMISMNIQVKEEHKIIQKHKEREQWVEMLLSVFMCVLASPHKTRASSGEGRGDFQHHCFSPGNKVIRKVTKLTMHFKWCSHFQACCNGIRSEVASRYASYLLFGRVGLIGKIIFNVCFSNFFSNLFCIRSRADIPKFEKKRLWDSIN